MPFKPTSLPDQIAAARGIEQQQVKAQPTSVSGGAAQQAKESAARWSQNSIRNPSRDAAAPWFAPGSRPFSEQRFQNQKNYDDWKGKFLGETDMGWKFASPPPEPTDTGAPAPADGGAA
jgi:hypothetical protein